MRDSVKFRPVLRAGVATAALCLALTACGGGSTTGPDSGAASGPSAEEANPDGHLRVGFTVPTPALNPHKMTSAPAAFSYLTPVYDRLTQMKSVDGELELAPMVATEWEFSEDGRAVVFTLREGITFSDGAALDAAAVKATLDHAKNTPGSTVASTLSMIESVEVVDPTHVKVVANRPAADIPYVLAGVEGSLISPQALDNPDLDINPVGSGPYVATSVKVGDSATYERREGYWDPAAQLSKTITIQGITDDNARLNALRSGQIDMMLAKVSQYNQASKLGSGFGYFAYPISQVYTLNVNNTRPNLDQQAVRQALNFAVDRDGINTSLLDGQCAPNPQPLTPPMNGFLTDPPIEYTYDPDKARTLLAEAGVENLTIETVVGAGLAPQNEIGEALKAQFNEIGVTLEVTPMQLVEAVGTYQRGNADAQIQVRVQEPSSAQSLVRNYSNPALFPGTTPPAFFDAVAPAYDPATSEEDVHAAVESANAVVTDEALDVFICGVATQFAFSDKVIGADSMGVSHYIGVMDLRYVGIAQ
ncbi:peptide/nickel transport system substrate-binding protein [Rhodococcus rhodochrous J3]|uniref:Peptide/nickel transport system substrate-binding protein n=2 Tax=Rhodococcus rhodochrous TaxID=1829 RepID=A0A562E778_RHORH|nr:peptide/nickel transport system substrate-binding protein [Rhodococcus rhodochrous J45]SMG59240.1 peptide/nickel transport system substrate-binding protein [Rhodococcus rhodochrous J3]